MEIKKEVKTVEIDYKCPKCKVGRLRPTGVKQMTYPPKYPHKCTNCDYTETFRNTYPYIDYE